MADEPGINRISLRVPAEMFQALEEKRFRLRTSFQQVGIELLQQWLANDQPKVEILQPSTITRAEQKWVDMLMQILHGDDKEVIRAVQCLLTHLRPQGGAGGGQGTAA